MSDPTYVMRAAGPGDLEGFKQLREIAGAGFTSLMLDDGIIDPRDTRAVLALCLDLCAQAARRTLRTMQFGVARP